MIPIEALREWHKGCLEYLRKEFPGLRLVTKNKVNAGKYRWEFETIWFPPNGKPKVIGGYFKFIDLENDSETVMEILALYPRSLKEAIRKELAKTNISDRKP